MTQNGEMSMKWLGKREFVPLVLFFKIAQAKTKLMSELTSKFMS